MLDKTKDLIAQAHNAVVERLSWAAARRDQAGIAKDLADGKDVPEIYGLGDAGLFDEFFFFLDHFDITALLQKLAPKPLQRTSNVNFSSVILIYVMRIVCGLAFFWHVPLVLLQSQSLMRLVGFNARQIQEGTNARGLRKRQDDGSSDQEDGEIRGPICADSIAKFIEAITARALERCFNGAIRILAAHRFFPKRVHAVLDASEIQSTQDCVGCGKVSKEKAPSLRHRKNRIPKVRVTVFGFKLWVVWDANTKIPLAMRFATIEVHDVNMAQEIIQQAMENLGANARIASLVCDRGFVDGKFMWWLDQNRIRFHIPAKTNMHVYHDALALVSSVQTHTRDVNRSKGSGRNRRVVVDHYEVAGIEGLTSAGFYGELGSGSHETLSDFVPHPINAVVVLDDPFKTKHPDADTLVILTNAPVDAPLKSYDAYDARSEIENSVFREAKQSWFLQRPARNTLKAFRAHAYLTILLMALTTAFRAWMEQQEEQSAKDKETGIRKFRQKIRQENANKFIVFDDDRYAIFEAYEIVILCGRRVARPRGTEETITQQDILRKYGVMLE